MEISERILLFITAVITSISALFCIISLATPRWALTYGLFCTGCSIPSAGLSIVAFILLIAALVILFLLACGILPKSTRVSSLVVLFLATIFTLASYASFMEALGLSGYSYKLMVVAHFLCYVASLITAFWLGGSYTGAIIQSNNP